VEAPIVAERDFYSVYFSRGVLLEADLVASRLVARDGGEAPRSVHQVYRAGDTGETAAHALAGALRGRGINVVDHAIPASAAPEVVATAARAAGDGDAVVGWLRPPDVVALGAKAPRGDIYLSAVLGAIDRHPLPPALRQRTHVAYPFDLPDRRRVRTDFAFGWFRIRKVDVVAEQVQADTFLACGLVSEVLNHMSDTFVRDYLVERVEDLVEHRVITGYYPRLTLATGQRFASKGGYIVRSGGERGTSLVAETAWVVP
jgi:hypothetical protein